MEGLYPTSSDPRGSFKFKIANSSGAALRVALFPANFDILNASLAQDAETPFAATLTFNRQKVSEFTNAGFDVDNVLDDGTIVSGLVGTSLMGNVSIRQMHDYIKLNTIMSGMVIVECDDVAGFSADLEISRVLPPTKLGTQILPLGEYLSTAQNIDTKIIIKEPFELSDESLWILEVPTGRTYTFTIKVN